MNFKRCSQYGSYSGPQIGHFMHPVWYRCLLPCKQYQLYSSPNPIHETNETASRMTQETTRIWSNKGIHVAPLASKSLHSELRHICGCSSGPVPPLKEAVWSSIWYSWHAAWRFETHLFMDDTEKWNYKSAANGFQLSTNAVGAVGVKSGTSMKSNRTSRKYQKITVQLSNRSQKQVSVLPNPYSYSSCWWSSRMLLLATPSWQVCKSSAWLNTIRVELHCENEVILGILIIEIYEVQQECLVLQKNIGKISEPPNCFHWWFCNHLYGMVFFGINFTWWAPYHQHWGAAEPKTHIMLCTEVCVMMTCSSCFITWRDTCNARLAVNHKDLDGLGHMQLAAPLTGKRFEIL